MVLAMATGRRFRWRDRVHVGNTQHGWYDAVRYRVPLDGVGPDDDLDAVGRDVDAALRANDGAARNHAYLWRYGTPAERAAARRRYPNGFPRRGPLGGNYAGGGTYGYTFERVERDPDGTVWAVVTDNYGIGD